MCTIVSPGVQKCARSPPICVKVRQSASGSVKVCKVHRSVQSSQKCAKVCKSVQSAQKFSKCTEVCKVSKSVKRVEKCAECEKSVLNSDYTYVCLLMNHSLRCR